MSTKPVRKADRVGVILSLGKAGWSTWNPEAATALATDGVLINLIEGGATGAEIEERAREIYPTGRYAPARAGADHGLSVYWIEPHAPFRIRTNSYGYEEIEWYKENEWICG